METVNWVEVGVFVSLMAPVGAAFLLIINLIVESKINKLKESLDGRYASREVTDIRLKAIERVQDTFRETS
jgi:hypothetical protein